MTSLSPQQSYKGFTITSITPVEAVRSTVIEITHRGTGARLIHLLSDDPENLFSVSFPTPPTDDTGVPHILEHMVLAGSEKFPVREPFFEMVKMSMATFINAMTGGDMTQYPVASNVKKDLFNLADVYFDAVFHPLLTEDTFRREGHHFCPEDPDNPLGNLGISGIVYNEMKGAFSSPESRMFYLSWRGLFPDNAFGNESGGEPEAIPDLTYQQLKQFHEKHYHPSNAYFVFVGNTPTTEYLDFLEDRLAPFSKQDPVASIERQPRWSEPRKVQETYAAVEGQVKEKTYISLDWIVGDAMDPVELMSFSVLSRVLLGNEAAPLKLAIIESKLGQDIFGYGASEVGKDINFGVGIQGSEVDRVEAFEKLVLETLKSIAEKPLDAEMVEAAIRRISFSELEIPGNLPLQLMRKTLSSWMHGKDPLRYHQMGAHLETLQQRYKEDPWYFNHLITKCLIDNTHRLTAVLSPDPQWAARTETRLKERLEKERECKSDDDMHRIAEDAVNMAVLAGTPNSPEQIAMLPQLQIEDIPKEPTSVSTTVEALPCGHDWLVNDVFANGVNYLAINIDLSHLPEDLMHWLSSYAQAIGRFGAGEVDYKEMARRISKYTGGIGCTVSYDGHGTKPNEVIGQLRLSMKALDSQLEDGLQVLEDTLFLLNLSDQVRLQEVVTQTLAATRNQFAESGNQVAGVHVARNQSLIGQIGHRLSGLPQLKYVENLSTHFDTEHALHTQQIFAIRDYLIGGAKMTASFTGSASAIDKVRARLSSWAERFGEAKDPVPCVAPSDFSQTSGSSQREGLATPGEVAYCVTSLPAVHRTHPDSAMLEIGSSFVDMDYLKNEVRLKGNAYGAWCQYSGFEGALTMSSYRDPNIAKTLSVYERVCDYVNASRWTQEDVNAVIIGTSKNFVSPIRPQRSNVLALMRHLHGITGEIRQEYFDSVKSVTPNGAKRVLLETLENVDKAPVCVVASREKLEANNKEMPGRELVIEDITKG